MRNHTRCAVPLDLSAATRRSGCTGAARTAPGATATAGDRGRRVHAHTVVCVGVDCLVTNAVSVLVNPPPPLLKQARRRVPLPRRRLQDVRLVFVRRAVANG